MECGKIPKKAMGLLERISRLQLKERGGSFTKSQLIKMGLKSKQIECLMKSGYIFQPIKERYKWI